MDSTRRDFIQRSATAATAVALGPITSIAASGPSGALEPELATPPTARALEPSLIRARPVPSSRVRVLGGPLKQAQDLTAKYLLELEPDRMLAYYRLRAGLPQKAAAARFRRHAATR